QAEGRAQPEAIDELHDGYEFLETIVQRRPREHDGVRRGDPLHTAGNAGAPVLDALGLVENHLVLRPTVNEIEVRVHRFVVEDLEEALPPKPLRARGAQAADDLNGPADEALDLALPLMLERGGADDEHALDAEMAGHDLGGGDRLDRLAQAHLVA